MIATAITTSPQLLTFLTKTTTQIESQKTKFIFLMIGAFVLIGLINLLIDLWLNRPEKILKQNHSLKQMKVNEVKKRIESELTKKAKVKRIYQIEMMCSQAGLNIGFGEYSLYCLLCAFLLPLFVFTALANPFLGFVCVPLGYMIPGQIIETIKNRRLNKLHKQVNSFMELFGERYKTVKSPSLALEDTLLDFENVQPIQVEIQKTILDIKLNTPPVEALEKMAERSRHTYFKRMISYLKIAEGIGTDNVRESLITGAIEQNRKNESRRNKLKSRIAGAKNTSMLLWFAVPGVMVYQSVTSPDYLRFMSQTLVGKVGLTFIVISLIGALWFINKKIAAPIE